MDEPRKTVRRNTTELRGVLPEKDVPPDVLEAIATRVERGAFPSLTLAGSYAVERFEREAVDQYRTSRRGLGRIRIVAKDARILGAVGLDDTELAIDDHGQLHYRIRQGWLAAVHRRIAYVFNGVGVVAAILVLAIPASREAVLGGPAWQGLAHVVFWAMLWPWILLAVMSARRRQFARSVLTGVLREEIAEARQRRSSPPAESAHRIAAAEKVHAVEMVLQSRGLVPSDEDLARIRAAGGEDLDDWLKRAAVASSVDEIFGRVRIAPAEVLPDEGEARDAAHGALLRPRGRPP